MTMIEKVARALALQHEINYGFKEPSELSWPAFDKSAKAAIEAMREPTDEMIAAGHGWHNTKESWQQMIDAALKED